MEEKEKVIKQNLDEDERRNVDLKHKNLRKLQLTHQIL